MHTYQGTVTYKELLVCLSEPLRCKKSPEIRRVSQDELLTRRKQLALNATIASVL